MGDEREYREIYKWKFHDGRYGLAAFKMYHVPVGISVLDQKQKIKEVEKETKTVFLGEFSDKESRDEKLNALKEQFQAKKLQVDIDTWKPETKWRFQNKKRHNEDDPDAYAQQIQQFLLCCGEEHMREILLLFAAVLAGYCSRITRKQYHDFVPTIEQRAPIVTIRQNGCAYAPLCAIMDTLAMDTVDDDLLFQRYKKWIPSKNDQNQIIQSIYLRGPKMKTRLMPQFRDTALMVHGKFFKKEEIQRLQKRNRWVTMILYAVSPRSAITPAINLSPEVFNLFEKTWKKREIRTCIAMYIRYLHHHYEEGKRKKWNQRIKSYYGEIQKRLRQYREQNRGQLPMAQFYRSAKLLLALRLFQNACVDYKLLKEETAEELLHTWYQTLYPTADSEKIEIHREWTLEERQQCLQEALEAVLKTDTTRVIKKEIVCELESKGLRGTVMFYLAKKEPAFWALVFPAETFLADLAKIESDPLQNISKKEICAIAKAYMRQEDQMRLGGDSCKVYAFYLERMTFLSENTRTNVLQKIADSKLFQEKEIQQLENAWTSKE